MNTVRFQSGKSGLYEVDVGRSRATYVVRLDRDVRRERLRRRARMKSTGQLTETQARVATNALVFGYFAALEQWYLEGGKRPIADYRRGGHAPAPRHLAGSR
ncbi:hypothetical protein [Nocardia sp. NPDC051463]|uniref:hypothetical protein n=1 Tax=Nocardia sp. NPDC051463 TaxID=3154845 RepID=UPI00344D526C